MDHPHHNGSTSTLIDDSLQSVRSYTLLERPTLCHNSHTPHRATPPMPPTWGNQIEELAYMILKQKSNNGLSKNAPQIFHLAICPSSNRHYSATLNPCCFSPRPRGRKSQLKVRKSAGKSRAIPLKIKKALSPDSPKLSLFA